MPAGLFAGDECRSRTEEWVDDDVATFTHVEQRVFQHGNRFDGGVVLPPLPPFGRQAISTRIGPDIRSSATILAALDIINVGGIAFFEERTASERRLLRIALLEFRQMDARRGSYGNVSRKAGCWKSARPV